MIVCPNCQHKNVAGAMFCAECGAQLDGVETLITQAITDEQIAEDLRKKRPDTVPTPANSWISLHLMDSGKILPLASRNEFTLGRLSEGQPIMPDIDLTPYQAYASGVSRLHAVVKRDVEPCPGHGPWIVQRHLCERAPDQSACRRIVKPW